MKIPGWRFLTLRMNNSLKNQIVGLLAMKIQTMKNKLNRKSIILKFLIKTRNRNKKFNKRSFPNKASDNRMNRTQLKERMLDQ